MFTENRTERQLNNGMVGSKLYDSILEEHRQYGTIDLDIYVCKQSEQEKNQTFLKLKKKKEKISATINRYLKEFALAILTASGHD